MRREHLSLLACPRCQGDLALREEQADPSAGVITGELVCDTCGNRYAIVRGVPRFVSSDNYASGFGFQWRRHARLQLDSYTGIGASRARFFGETGWPQEMGGDLILEVGSGAGRFTEQAAGTGATVASIDCSDAVDANFALHRHARNVLIAQADLYHLPFRRATFDRVFCFGVLQHTPDPARAFHMLPAYLKPGGSLAIDVYEKHHGVKRFFDTKYWARPLTRHIPHQTLYRLVSAYIRCVWPLASVIGRIPGIGRRLNWKLLIADWRDELPLPDGVLKEWAILDTFDMLAPAYDRPQSLDDVRTWCRDSLLLVTRMARSNGLVVVNTVMSPRSSSAA